MIRRLLLALLGLISLASLGGATSYASPQRREVYSGNGQFLLVVDPETASLTMFAAADPGKALWSFKAEIWHQPFLPSNDGQTVTEVAWRHVGEAALSRTNCVIFHAADGSRQGIPFARVCPDPPKTQDVGVGPIGNEWRTWYQDADVSGDVLSIHTTTGTIARFDLAKRQLIGIQKVPVTERLEEKLESRRVILPVVLTAAVIVGGIGLLAWQRRKGKRLRSCWCSGHEVS
jgi:hypothetical protein